MPVDAHQQEGEPDQRGPAGAMRGRMNARDAVERQEQREEVAGVAERPEDAAAEPDADRAHRARLVQRLPPGS